MASQKHLIKLRSTESKDVYYTRKNKKSVERKMELKKYDKNVKKHVLYKEAKK